MSRKSLLRDHFIKLRCSVLQNMLLHILHQKNQLFLSEGNRYFVAHLHFIRGLHRTAVHADVLGIAGIVGNGTPLDDAGDLQKFVDSHPFSSLL